MKGQHRIGSPGNPLLDWVLRVLFQRFFETSLLVNDPCTVVYLVRPLVAGSRGEDAQSRSEDARREEVQQGVGRV